MPSHTRLGHPLDAAGTALLTVECQEGAVGAGSALPELAEEARSSGALGTIARLAAAHARGVQALHALAERRPDGRGAGRNARLFHAAEPLPVRQPTGSAAVRVAAPIEVTDEDLVVRRLHGLSPIQGTEADALLRNLGRHTLIVTGVSATVAVPHAVFDAVDFGYAMVVPTDATAGVPADCARALIRHTLALVATLTTTGELLTHLAGPTSPAPRAPAPVGAVRSGTDLLRPA